MVNVVSIPRYLVLGCFVLVTHLEWPCRNISNWALRFLGCNAVPVAEYQGRLPCDGPPGVRRIELIDRSQLLLGSSECGPDLSVVLPFVLGPIMTVTSEMHTAWVVIVGSACVVR